MIHPSYVELMQSVNKDSDPENPVVKSRYSIVTATARRARQLIDQNDPAEDFVEKKPLSIAVDEIYRGSVKILSEDQAREFKEEEERNKLLEAISDEGGDGKDAAKEEAGQEAPAEDAEDQSSPEAANEEAVTAEQAAQELEAAAETIEEALDAQEA